jgi:hypothetical protein
MVDSPGYRDATAMTNGRIFMVAWRGTAGKRNFIVFLDKAIGVIARVHPKKYG